MSMILRSPSGQRGGSSGHLGSVFSWRMLPCMLVLLVGLVDVMFIAVLAPQAPLATPVVLPAAVIDHRLEDNLSHKPLSYSVARGVPSHSDDKVPDPDDVLGRTSAALLKEYGLLHKPVPVCPANLGSLTLVGPCDPEVVWSESLVSCQYQLRREAIAMVVGQTGIKTLVTTKSILQFRLSGLQSLFDRVYVVECGSLVEVKWEGQAGGISNIVDKPSAAPYDGKQAVMLLGDEYFEWEFVEQVLLQRQGEDVRWQNVIVSFLNSDIEPPHPPVVRTMAAVQRIGCTLSPSNVLILYHDLLVVRPPAYFFKSTPCLRADATLLRTPLPKVNLASYPKSGSQLLRFMLEQSTGVLTGSIYHDTVMEEQGFVAEKYRIYSAVPNVAVSVINDHSYPPAKPLVNARVVHLVRDPFAVIATSVRALDGNDIKHDDDVQLLALDSFFHEQMKNWIAHTQFYLSIPPERRVTVRYEDLAEKTEETLEAVIKFLNNTAVINPAQLRCAAATNVCATTNWVCPDGPMAAASLQESDRKKVIEQYQIAPLLKELGYHKLLESQPPELEAALAALAAQARSQYENSME